MISENTFAVDVPPSSSICLLIFAGVGIILGTGFTAISGESATPPVLSARYGAILAVFPFC